MNENGAQQHLSEDTGSVEGTLNSKNSGAPYLVIVFKHFKTFQILAFEKLAVAFQEDARVLPNKVQ
eukprot:2776015-Pyramimonas_sp.AAC.2